MKDYAELLAEQAKLEGYRAVRKARIERVMIRVLMPICFSLPLLIPLGISVHIGADANAVIALGAWAFVAWIASFMGFGMRAEDIRLWLHKWSEKASEETKLKRTEKKRLQDIAFFQRLETDAEFRRAWIEERANS